MPDNYQTNLTPAVDAGGISELLFIIGALMARARTAIPVQVMAVSNAGGVSPVGTVDIQVLVDQVDGQGNAVPHGTIYGCPYLRIQGGANAVILDPKVGDIGLAVICDRDISAVKGAAANAPPGSKRQNDLADAVYLSTIISKTTPTQYVEFQGNTLTILSPGTVNVVAPSITLGSSGETLQTLLTHAAATLFNSHTHPPGAGGNTGTPNQTMGTAQETTVVKAG